MRFVATCCVGLAVLAVGGGLTAGEKGKTMLKAGDKAPEFQGVDENGNVWKSSDHVGKKVVVLFFFPAALTGG
jgi:peroxiredoxin Q/BCP